MASEMIPIRMMTPEMANQTPPPADEVVRGLAPEEPLEGVVPGRPDMSGLTRRVSRLPEPRPTPMKRASVKPGAGPTRITAGRMKK